MIWIRKLFKILHFVDWYPPVSILNDLDHTQVAWDLRFPQKYIKVAPRDFLEVRWLKSGLFIYWNYFRSTPIFCRRTQAKLHVHSAALALFVVCTLFGSRDSKMSLAARQETIRLTFSKFTSHFKGHLRVLIFSLPTNRSIPHLL